MKGLKKTRRIQVIIASAVLLALATGLIGFALKDGINLFRAPSQVLACLLYTSPSPRDVEESRMPSSA